MRSLDIRTPLTGTLVPIDEVPDPVFSKGLVGPGVAIVPTEDGDVEVVAPIPGKIAKIHPHAFVIMSGAVNVLVHLGLDTVSLDGEGFTVHASTGDTVEAGQHLITWNPTQIRERNLDPICPVVFMETKQEILITAAPQERVEKNDFFAQAGDSISKKLTAVAWKEN